MTWREEHIQKELVGNGYLFENRNDGKQAVIYNTEDYQIMSSRSLLLWISYGVHNHQTEKVRKVAN